MPKPDAIDVRVSIDAGLLRAVVIVYGKPTRAFKEEYHLSMPILESKHGKTDGSNT